jgi:hypothetical protein
VVRGRCAADEVVYDESASEEELVDEEGDESEERRAEAVGAGEEAGEEAGMEVEADVEDDEDVEVGTGEEQEAHACPRDSMDDDGQAAKGSARGGESSGAESGGVYGEHMEDAESQRSYVDGSQATDAAAATAERVEDWCEEDDCSYHWVLGLDVSSQVGYSTTYPASTPRR